MIPVKVLARPNDALHSEVSQRAAVTMMPCTRNFASRSEANFQSQRAAVPQCSSVVYGARRGGSTLVPAAAAAAATAPAAAASAAAAAAATAAAAAATAAAAVLLLLLSVLAISQKLFLSLLMGYIIRPQITVTEPTNMTLLYR